MSTQSIYREWGEKILQALYESAFVIEKYHEDELNEFRAYRPHGDISLDIRLRDSGVVFTIEREINHEWSDKKNLISAMNKTSQLVRAFKIDENIIGFSFCYPILADVDETFGKALMNFIEEVDDCSDWLESKFNP